MMLLAEARWASRCNKQIDTYLSRQNYLSCVEDLTSKNLVLLCSDPSAVYTIVQASSTASLGHL